LPLLGGFKASGLGELAAIVFGVLVTAFSEEALYRGVVWRALYPTGVMRTAVITALLFGVVHVVKPIVFGGSAGQAIQLVIATTCGGFTYSALRHRTASIWPPMLFHFVFDVVSDTATPHNVPYLLVVMAVLVTLGFAAYGMFLLRNARVRADGGLTSLQQPAHVT